MVASMGDKINTYFYFLLHTFQYFPKYISLVYIFNVIVTHNSL